MQNGHYWLQFSRGPPISLPSRPISLPSTPIWVPILGLPPSSIRSNKGNADKKRSRHGLPHFDLHHAIFGFILATGRFVALSTNLYLRRSIGDDDEDSDLDDMETFTMDIGPHFEDKRASSSRRENTNKKKKGKSKTHYEASIEEMYGVYVANHKKDVTSQQSRQTGPVTVEMSKIIEVVTALLDVDDETMVGAIEFFRMHPDA